MTHDQFFQSCHAYIELPASSSSTDDTEELSIIAFAPDDKVPLQELPQGERITVSISACEAELSKAIKLIDKRDNADLTRMRLPSSRRGSEADLQPAPPGSPSAVSGPRKSSFNQGNIVDGQFVLQCYHLVHVSQ